MKREEKLLTAQVQFRGDDLIALQAWRTQHKFPPVARAVRELVKIGLGTRDESRDGDRNE